MIAGFPLSGFWRRVGASLVDGVFLWVLALIVTFLVVGIGGSSLGLLLIYVSPVVYYVWGWSSWSGGQTFGKRALSQRLVDREGQPLSKLRAFGRFLGSVVSALPFGLGYLWAAWDPEKQTWHDKMVGSYVVSIAGAASDASTVGSRFTGIQSDVRAPCPRCGESIPLHARVCRFCGVEFEVSDATARLG